ncbi:MAG: hypothetical protein ABII90_03885, partial [Bacteroidota bacterium]
HVHIKLYPLHGLDEKFKEIWAQKRIYFKRYKGYISTQLGPEKTYARNHSLHNTPIKISVMPRIVKPGFSLVMLFMIISC